jgi:hypothetical protein
LPVRVAMGWGSMEVLLNLWKRVAIVKYGFPPRSMIS